MILLFSKLLHLPLQLYFPYSLIMFAFPKALFLAHALTSLPTAYSLCYYRDGTQVRDEGFVACHDVVQGSYPWCCALNRGKQHGRNVSASEARDVCMPNGLCQNADDGTKFSYYRNFCSNPAWDGCLKKDPLNEEFIMAVCMASSKAPWYIARTDVGL